MTGAALTAHPAGPFSRPASAEQASAMVAALTVLLGSPSIAQQAATVLTDAAGGTVPALVAEWVALLPEWIDAGGSR